MTVSRTLGTLCFSALIGLAFSRGTTTTTTSSSKDHKPGDFDWQSITPSWDLEYHPCYDDDFQCARLLLPLDWLEQDAAKQKLQLVAIAIIRLPAVVPPHDETYGGSVLINPGGPGDSGVLHILYNGAYIRNMMDTEGERHFDMVSFDPRGMANSLPIADCFASEVERTMYDWQQLGKPIVKDGRDSNTSLAMELSHAAALSMKCAANKGPDDVLMQEYMSTASVARDMLRMVDEFDRLERAHVGSTIETGAQKKLTGAHGGQKGGAPVPRIQYYGTSYGTVLGNTFISMFPGRVKRMILDGVVFAEDWISGDFCTFLADSTASIDYFYQTCFSAGSKKCPLTRDADKSWHVVKNRVQDLIAHLDANPIPVAVDGLGPTVLSGNAVTGRMMDPIYAPIDLYPGLGRTLAAAVEGNYTALIAESGFAPTDGDEVCKSKAGDAAAYKWMGLANSAVRCGDGDDLRDKSIGHWREYKRRCVATSPEIGALWADLSCAGWQIRPRERFAGPFGAPEADPVGVEGRPSAPVLFLSSRFDPVTPLVSANEASKKHPGSRVVVQEATGHCTLLSGPSECTRKVTRAYMLSGAMPEGGISCKVDCVPFEECDQPRAKLPR
ncbi:proteinase [Cordyceps javanica]|uniref:Proteinase n=1 Tax=Cordyceps javanica TaxID=43265 RepID=A0A545W3X6_9HYPO|nr:proteinase [Cordyceps javanica]TQW08699.1 proteinase [Cordyceps javanica]